MDIRPIRTEADHKLALREISALMESDPLLDSSEGTRLDVLSILVEAFERRHYPIDPPDPVEAIKFRMDQYGLTVADLEPMIGRRNRVYEVLKRRRPLSIEMIRELHKGLGISAATLIQPSPVEAAPASKQPPRPPGKRVRLSGGKRIVEDKS